MQKMLKKQMLGFSLVELLITVAIVGILASIAYPSYVNFVSRSNRSEAQRELMRLANLQEQLYVDTHTYTANMTDLGQAVDPYVTESGHYSIDATINGATFKLTATAIGSQLTADPDCTTLSVDETGSKTAETATCWEK